MRTASSPAPGPTALGRAKEALKRSRSALVAYHLVDNWRTRRRFAAGRTELESGSTHESLELEESLAYIDTVYHDYLTYGGLREADLVGRSVLELGPGDNLGVALRFLAAGAKEVTTLDRFRAPRDERKENAIYAALRDRLPEPQRRRLDEVLRPEGDGFRLDPSRLRTIHGVGVEDAPAVLREASFDLVVSRAVLEHLYDAEAALSSVEALLAPGGRSVHKVDMRDHGMFSEYGFHPLEFLTVSPGVYGRMTRDSGKPNRKLMGFWVGAFRALDPEARVWVTHLVGRQEEYLPHLTRVPDTGPDADRARDLVRSIRGRLARPFRDLPEEDLMVQGLFLSATKRSAPAPAQSEGSRTQRR